MKIAFSIIALSAMCALVVGFHLHAAAVNAPLSENDALYLENQTLKRDQIQASINEGTRRIDELRNAYMQADGSIGVKASAICKSRGIDPKECEINYATRTVKRVVSPAPAKSAAKDAPKPTAK
jgi:hypothetical protein